MGTEVQPVVRRLLAVLTLAVALAAAPGLRAEDAPAPGAEHRQALDAAFKRLDLDAVARYLTANGGAMDAQAPGLQETYRLQLLLWLGREDDAHALRERATQDHPELAENHKYAVLAKAQDSRALLPPKMLMDYELAGNQRQIQQLQNEGQSLKLHRRLRELIEQRRDQVVLTDDPDVFRGAASAYREVFAPLQKGYDAYLDDYIAALATTGELSPADLAKKRDQLQLGPLPQTPRRAWPTTAPAWPAKTEQVKPESTLALGAMEFHAIYDPYDRHLGRMPLAPAVHAGDLALLQTTRDLQAFRDGKLRWRYQFDPTWMDPQAETSDRHNRYYVSPSSPSTGGGLVVARMLAQREYRLVALDLANGAERWQARPDGFSVCSDPTVWRDQVLVLARRDVSPIEYHMLSLDLASGELRASFYLYSGSPRTEYIEGLTKTVQFDRAMPRPTVDRDIAYFASNAGMIGAVDLARDSLMWIRRYPRLQFELAPDILAELPTERLASPPVIGEDVALFAPVDALQMIAVDRLTGAPRAVPKPLRWSAITAAGPDRALILGPDRLGLTVLKLGDGSIQGILAAEKGWAWAHDTAGHLLLQRDGQLGQLEGDANPRFQSGPAAAPPPAPQPSDVPGAQDMTLVAHNGASVLYATSGPAGYQIYASGEWPKPKPLEPPRPLPPSAEMIGVDFQAIGGVRYAVGQNAITRLTDDLRQLWSCPVPERPIAVHPVGDQLLVAFGVFVWSIDASTGIVQASWPEVGARVQRVTCVGDGPDGPLFGVRIDDDNAQVLAWNRGRPTVFGGAGNTEHILAISEQGQTILGANSWRATPRRLDPESRTYQTMGIDSVGVDMAFRYGQVFPVTNGNYVVANDYERAVVWTGQAFERFDLQQKGAMNNHGFAYRLTADVITTATWDEDRLLYTVDLRHQRDLTTRLNPIRRPYVDDDVIVGASPGDGKAINGWSYNRKTDKLVTLGELDVKDQGGALKSRHNLKTDFALKVGNLAYTIFGQRSDRPTRIVRHAVAQDVTTGFGEMIYLPGWFRSSDVIATDDHILLAVDDTLVRMSSSYFRKLATDHEPLAGRVNRSFEPTIDGFADDWPAGGFRPVGRNRVQVASTLYITYVAIEIRDPDVIARICAPGALARTHLVLGPGDALLPSEFLQSQGGSIVAPILDDHGGESDVAFTVSPAGDRMFIEARYRNLNQDDAKFMRIFIGRSPAADKFGDLGVDLRIQADRRGAAGPFPTANPGWESLLAPDEPTALPRFDLPKN